MSLALEVFGWLMFSLALLVGLALDLLGLFGNWIILAAVILAYAFSGFEHFGIPSIIVLFFLAAAGEIIEALASAYGAKRFGGVKGTMVAALVGTIVGAIVGTPVPIVGSLIGACAGAFIGAVSYEYVVRRREMGSSMKAGFGAAAGKIGGVFAKLFVGLVMIIIIFFTVSPAAPAP